MPDNPTTSSEFPKAYEPQPIEQRWAKALGRTNNFSARTPKAPGPVFSIVIPPPNVTGSLHIGHMLDHTEIDILVALAPHARLQHAVSAGHGSRRHFHAARGGAPACRARDQLPRRWAAKSLSDACGSGRKNRAARSRGRWCDLGESCDWTREKFTLSPELSRAVTEVFVRLYEEGLIYRGHYIVNWCPQCRTAISDLETVHQERQGHLWHIRYPVVGSQEFVVVATTRPETMLGDTAVAVHPDDERYQHLIGKKVLLPLMNREIPIIADIFVDREFGTGAVKVTPAHDPNDFEMGRRHDLPRNRRDDRRRQDERGGRAVRGTRPLRGAQTHRRGLEASRACSNELTDHTLAVGTCDRCGTIVEPRAFDAMVREDEAAGRARDRRRRARRDRDHSRESARRLFRVDAQHPRLVHLAAALVGTPDSRLALRRLQGNHRRAARRRRNARTAARRSLIARYRRARDLVQLRAVAVFDAGLAGRHARISAIYYPTSLLHHRLRHSVFLGRADDHDGPELYRTQVPFRQVYLHSLVRTAEGQKMSKSKGTGIDPIELNRQIRHRRDALHAGQHGRAGHRHRAQRRPHPQLPRISPTRSGTPRDLSS